MPISGRLALDPRHHATSHHAHTWQVRRTHLIHDTLLQMGMRKDDLKKPLKVQFAGEDGIDEGGVQKEFFQLIFSQVLPTAACYVRYAHYVRYVRYVRYTITQIFDVSYGMFVYDEDARLYWSALHETNRQPTDTQPTPIDESPQLAGSTAHH